MLETIDEEDKIIRKLTFKEKLEIGKCGEKITDERIVDIIHFFTAYNSPRRWYIEKSVYQKLSPYERYKKYQGNGIDGLLHYDSLLVQVKTRQLAYLLEEDIYFELGRSIKGINKYSGWYWKNIDLLLYYFYSLTKKKIMCGYVILLDEFKKTYNTPVKINKKFEIKCDWNFNPTKIYFCPKFKDFPNNSFYDITPIVKELE